MSWLTRPHVWLALALPVLSGTGAWMLADPACTNAEEEFLQVFAARHYWQTSFDGLSAACGVGLLTYDFDEDYTPRGRWTLTAIGLAGAIVYLLAAAQVWRRLATIGTDPGRDAGSERLVRPPHPALAPAVFVAVLVILVVAFWAGRRVCGSDTTFSDAAWQVSAAFASLGWSRDPYAGLAAWPVAVVSLLGALGWAVWIIVVPAWRRRHVPARGLCWSPLGYVVFLLLVAALVCALESPRAGPRGAKRQAEELADRPLAGRYARSVTQVVCASGAGTPTEALSDRCVSDGTKMTLGAVVLVGGMGGAAGGGVRWPLLVAAFGGLALVVRRSRRQDTRERPIPRYVLAGSACVLAMLALATVVAFGLILIENYTASPYHPSPTFADAFLDACSAVGGANLSSGLTAQVTSRNLISGIRQAADLYQYGMVWLMLAMWAGRLLPLVVLWRIADGRPGNGRSAAAPLV